VNFAMNNDRFCDDPPEIHHIRELSDSSPSEHVRITNAGQMRDLCRAVSVAVRRAITQNEIVYVYRTSANRFTFTLSPDDPKAFCIFEAKPPTVFLMEESASE
jgi:hypothetical protein